MIVLEPIHFVVYFALGMLFAAWILTISDIPKTSRNAAILTFGWVIWLGVLIVGFFYGSDDDA